MPWWNEIASEMNAKLTTTNAAPPTSAAIVIATGSLSTADPRRKSGYAAANADSA
jgi:hypothetical protein